MSFILDALKKSERERKLATGDSVNLYYPIEIKRDRKLRMVFVLLILVTLVTLALIWRILTESNSATAPLDEQATKLPNAAAKSLVIPLAGRKANESLRTFQVTAEPEQVNRPKKTIAATTNKILIVPKPENTSKIIKTHVELIQNSSDSKKVSADPLEGLPALVVSGYIHNEQNGSFAMINNQLVHEGEEISPGLTLVKILDSSAIFSYKGYVFSR